MANESEFMLGIAAAVADGAVVDWDQVESQVTTDDDKRVLRSLRLVSVIGTVHDSVGGESEAPTRTVQPAAQTMPAAESAVLAAGKWGRYELREKLGAGAQGAVYRAWDPQLECEVALKVLQPRLAASDRVGERMLREGRALAKVRHQNVVNVYAAEVHEGQVGLCMEFIRGRTLEEILKAQGPFGEGEAVTVGLKVGHALSAVHAAGIVHRDVKARNVMREDRGRIVLMDFGTGRDRAKAGTGDLAGTPLYMAPEVLAGSAATQQSDIYSVGVLLYYLVTGQYPVEGKTLDQIIQAHVRGRRKPLAERRPDLPDDFIRVVDRATAQDPDARYETAALLVHDLVSLETTGGALNLAPRTVTQRVFLGAAWAGIAAIGIMLLGFVTSIAFNAALERVAVSGETPRGWFIWGLRALLAPIFNVVQVLFGIVVVVAIWRVLRRFVGPFDLYAARLSRQLRSLARRLGLWNVDSYGLIAFICALAFFVIIVLSHSTLVSAIGSTVSNMTVEQRLALSPEHREAYFRYRWQLEWLIWATTLASIRLVRMRRIERTPTSAVLLTALVGVLIPAVVIWAAPWRLVMQSDRPKMLFDGQRCYDLGREGSQVLLYCPDGPERVLRVSVKDTRLHDTGITETVFSTH
jgi:tRNA A-37 threonylcarbamoyl transferase component Bud32